MTDKTVREKIVEGNPYKNVLEAVGHEPAIERDKHNAWEEGTAFVLALKVAGEPETYTDMGGNTHKLRDRSITLSELIEKAESGKLVEVIYVGHAHFQTTERLPDNSYAGESYWSTYIPSVMLRKMGIEPEEGKLYVLSLAERLASGELR